jgi:hypothetical protein
MRDQVSVVLGVRVSMSAEVRSAVSAGEVSRASSRRAERAGGAGRRSDGGGRLLSGFLGREAVGRGSRASSRVGVGRGERNTFFRPAGLRPASGFMRMNLQRRAGLQARSLSFQAIS